MKKLRTKTVKVKSYSTQWQLHQALGRFARQTDHIPDLTEILTEKRKTAPLVFIDLLF